jgi:hypothetical protein
MDTVNSYGELTKMCMQENSFQFNVHYDRQTFDTSMENALSQFLANIFMAELQTRLSKLKIFPKVWIRYVNDIFCIMKKNTIDRMLVIMMKRCHNTIKFTHEDNETLGFWTHKSNVSKKNSHSTSTANLRPIIDTFRLSLPQHPTQISSFQLYDSSPYHHTTVQMMLQQNLKRSKPLLKSIVILKTLFTTNTKSKRSFET